MTARILVVEDERIVAMDLSHRLTTLGYEVVGIASSGEEAVSAAQEHRPDLVLMDIILKGELDGIETARRIRALRSIPVVYLTAYADDETLGRALKTAPFGYLLKPFEERELKITIEMALYKYSMEERLAAQQARYRAVVAQSAEGILLLDAATLRIVEANDAIRRLLGFDHTTLEAMTAYDIVDTPREAFSGEIAALARDGARMLGVRRLRAQGQRKADVELSATMITSLPQPLILLLARDLSDIRRHEAELERHRANLEAVIENTNDAVWSVNRDLEVITCNSAFRARFTSSFGVELQPGVAILSLLPPAEADEWRNYYRRTLAGERFAIERTFAYGGNKAVYEISFNPIRSADQAITGASVFARDISARKNVEAALRDSRRMLQGLLDNLPGMAYCCANDPDWTMVYVSDGSLALTGLPAEDLINNHRVSFAELIHPNDRQRVWDSVQAAIAADRRYQLQYRLLTADGRQKWVWDQGFAVRSADGDVETLEGLVVDISDRHAAEVALREAKDRAEEASRMKDSILANMSHELRTPMTAILGFSELLARRLKDQELASHAQMIYRGGKRLLELVNNIIDLARIEANKLSLQRTAHPVAETIARVTELLHILAERKGLSLTAHVDPDLIVDTDPQREEQIITNIVSNAIRFTEHGSITISARRRSSDEPRGGDIEVNVKDTGVGISPDFLPHIFEEFRQESEGLTRAYEGSGLGLAIARKLLERMQGEIWIESIKHQGTTVTIVLPSAHGRNLAGSERGNQGDASTGDQESPVDADNGKRRRILVVEDNIACSTLVREILGDLHEVIVSDSGEAALARTQRERFDAVLMDINLKSGGLDGIATLQRLRQNAAHGKTPVFAMTAYAMQGDEEKFREVGFDGYLAKPFDRRRLRELLSELDQLLGND